MDDELVDYGDSPLSEDIIQNDSECEGNPRFRSSTKTFKRIHSDNSEDEISLREIRKRRTTTAEAGKDSILMDSTFVFAKMSQPISEIKVFQSDLDKIRSLENELDMNVPGYLGSDAQTIRLIHLYKYKRASRDGSKGATVMLKNMKKQTLLTSWKSMTNLLRKGPNEFDSHCAKKESQKGKFSRGGSNLKKDVHTATLEKQGFCLVLQEEESCHECTMNNIANKRTQQKVVIEYVLFGFEEVSLIKSYLRFLSEKRAKEAKLIESASPRTQRAYREYLPREQISEARYLGPLDNQANERDTQSHATLGYYYGHNDSLIGIIKQ